jgi:hypothetical protein
MFNNLYRQLSRLGRNLTPKFDKSSHELGMLPSPVLVNSIPKSGTNLLMNIVFALPNARFVEDMSLASSVDKPEERLEFVRERIRDLSPGAVYTGHIPYSPAIADWILREGIQQVFIYRDPRDITVSGYHYIMERQPKHDYYELYASLKSDSERLLASICGIGEGRTKYKLSPSSIPNIKLVFDAYEQWLSDANTFSLSYEDLTEAEDNGMDVTEKMLHFLGVPFDEALVEMILSRGKDPNRSLTFRRGGSGAWKDEYSERHIEAFQLMAGDLLETWGYTWE